MKTMKNLLFVAFAAISITACQKELADPNADAGTNAGAQPEGNYVTFTGSLDQVDTKTTIWYNDAAIQEGKCETMFMLGDHISVNGNESEDIIKEDGTTGAVVTFSVQEVSAPYHAVTAQHVSSYSDGTYIIKVNGTSNFQDYRLVKSDKSAVSFDSAADILAAYNAEETSLKFKHMSTFFAITVNPEGSTVADNIKSIYIRQAGDQPNIAGTWKLTYDGEGNAPVLTPDELTEVIAYDCTDEGVAHGKAMIIGIPAYNYTDGLIITIKDVNGKFASFKIPASKTDYSDMGGVITPFNPTFNPGSGEIKSAQDWNDFADAVNSGKDWELYRWLGNGTVKLGADINDDEVELKSITKEFKYIFDGNGKKITRACSDPLFETVTGEIKNLILSGAMSGVASLRNGVMTVLGAPFVGILEGGKVTSCTNEMSVTVGSEEQPVAANIYASGFVASMYGGTVSFCVNKKPISVYVDASTDIKPNVAVSGIVADIRNADVTSYLKDCTNLEGADITVTPKSSSDNTTGMTWCGVGGITGMFRYPSSLDFYNCDNLADITLSGDMITSIKGLYKRVISVGGILGIAAPCSGLFIDPSTEDYPETYAIKLENCDNFGLVYNCATNYSTSSESHNKVYTAGIAGALMGTSANYAKVITCKNTGNVITYDKTGDEASNRPAYCVVAGGLIGYGGYLDISGCTVQCQIGNGKRQMVAWGGVIGFAVRPFNFKNGVLALSGYFQRISNYKFNRAVVAVVPDETASGTVPDVKGSKIEGTITASGKLMSSSNLSSSYTDCSDLSLTLTTPLFGSKSKMTSNLIGGGANSQTTASTAGVEVTAEVTYN